MQHIQVRLAHPLTIDSIVDGPGLRSVLWCQGCLHDCVGCHNPQTHALLGGGQYLIDDVVQEIKQAKIQSGLTLSGGEPFLQARELLEIVIKVKPMNIWAYSGYTFDEINANPIMKKLLQEIDVLVDGKYHANKKDYTLKFKGSSNQRVIDVKASLEANEIVLWQTNK